LPGSSPIWNPRNDAGGDFARRSGALPGAGRALPNPPRSGPDVEHPLGRLAVADVSGERHEIHIRLVGGNAAAAGARLCDGLAEAEFSLAGLIVADICVVGVPRPAADGSVEIEIEALTIEE